MCTARPESPSWPGDRLLLAWVRQTRGHQVRELASSPLAQVAPLGGIGADTGLMGSTRQTGAYQTACDHNQQWQRTMNAIIYKNTVQVSLRLCLLRLFTLPLLSRGSMGGLWPCRYSRQQDFSTVPRTSLLFPPSSPSGLISAQLQRLHKVEGDTWKWVEWLFMQTLCKWGGKKCIKLQNERGFL